MIKPVRLCLFIILINCSSLFAGSVSHEPAGLDNGLPGTRYENVNPDTIPIPVRKRDTLLVVVPFEFKQSALMQPRTLEAIDSVILILLKNDKITITINGFAHMDEGSNKICQYLSEDRAGFIKDYVLARGVDSSRILAVNGYGNTRPFYKGTNKYGVLLNCRAEVKLNYPIPPEKIIMPDTDEDGLTDNIDKCPLVFGDKENNGCPRNNILVVFEKQQAYLPAAAFTVMDSVIGMLKNNPAITIGIEGYACTGESEQAGCDRLSKERAELVRDYLLSRYVGAAKIEYVKSFSNHRPLNAGKTPRDILLNSRVEIVVNKH